MLCRIQKCNPLSVKVHKLCTCNLYNFVLLKLWFYIFITCIKQFLSDCSLCLFSHLPISSYYDVIFTLLCTVICFGQGYPSYLSGSVECSHLPSAVASQIHERHRNYQRGDTESELIRSTYCNVN